jgi:hypothetical protein
MCRVANNRAQSGFTQCAHGPLILVFNLNSGGKLESGENMWVNISVGILPNDAIQVAVAVNKAPAIVAIAVQF